MDHRWRPPRGCGARARMGGSPYPSGFHSKHCARMLRRDRPPPDASFCDSPVGSRRSAVRSPETPVASGRHGLPATHRLGRLREHRDPAAVRSASSISTLDSPDTSLSEPGRPLAMHQPLCHRQLPRTGGHEQARQHHHRSSCLQRMWMRNGVLPKPIRGARTHSPRPLLTPTGREPVRQLPSSR